ncbi:D-alanyl-D-alanine carboxypeptidase [Streptomyces sp. A1136]|nr:D-alanyl-D-alanine carboxypeptidase [Streptomyces sp. A1136]
MLAELTNTAPSPETPRRTLVRRVKVWTPIVLLLGAAVAGGQILRPLPTPQLVATQDSVTLDGTTAIPWPAEGQAAVRIPGSGDIGTFGEQKPVPTASVAKVMTAYVILRNHPLRKNQPGPRIEVDAKAVAEGNAEHESKIEWLTAGQKFSEQDMLEMLMLKSANNIARLLARWDTGNDEAAFVAKMNAVAKELGMRDTTYTDPSGLNSGTVSTAVDQLKLAEAVMQEEAFRAIVATAHAKIEGLPEQIDNSNDLLSVKGLRNIGIKTGSSTPAGGTLMWAADQPVGGDTPLILGTMMDQHVDGPDEDAGESLKLVLKNSRKVIEAVRKALAAAPVIHKGQTVGYVSDGLGGRTPLVATKDLAVIGVPGQRLRFTLGTTGGKSVPHEAKAGTEVAVLTVGDGPGSKTVPVAVGTRLAEPSFGTRVIRLS